MKRPYDYLETKIIADLSIKEGVSEDDLAYILFTSGSTGLPKGVTAKVSNDFEEIEFKGKCSQAGKYNATVKVRDELSNNYTYNVTFLIGDTNKIFAAAYPVRGVKSDGDFDFDRSIYVSGGSGSYKYSFVGDSYDLSVSGGELYGSLKKTGKFRKS